jgi:hypothetical protein
MNDDSKENDLDENIDATASHLTEEQRDTSQSADDKNPSQNMNPSQNINPTLDDLSNKQQYKQKQNTRIGIGGSNSGQVAGHDVVHITNIHYGNAPIKSSSGENRLQQEFHLDNPEDFAKFVSQYRASRVMALAVILCLLPESVKP